ncbi:hypothetical protein JVT61DRAFT_14509 [Boletus reticuloceps]|uniref:Protein-S-isoprenylcysteine O-methyltransferase n=1 Tax=Boletus reticuloceps TaxID=495285 RepID=A0A8I2YW54_9AGAM|nr:hypothetical protein JVT61DRAFT_14509 [Boletus reticuloceps]
MAVVPVRLLLLIVGVVAQYVGITPPNVHPPNEQLREQRGLERSLDLVLVTLRILLWSWAFIEGSILFALSGYCPPAFARPFLHLPTNLTSDPTELTPAFLTGIVLTLAGALLRVSCYRALGKHFTFQLSIRPTHALVTDGVYGIIRHPSYTGFMMHTVGYLFCVLDRQGPIVSVCTGLLDGSGTGHTTVTRVWACVWATGLYLIYALMFGRMNKEDEMLQKNIGEEWRAWVKRVPYRLLPGVY